MFSSLVRVVLFIVVVAGSTGVARARDVVPFSGGVAPGTIIVKTAERRLYFVINDGSAVRYPVAVGRPAKQWEAGGEYAIHGTNRPESIGKYASYGCIRMYNEDIAHLFQRVSVGTPVVVTR